MRHAPMKMMTRDACYVGRWESLGSGKEKIILSLQPNSVRISLPYSDRRDDQHASYIAESFRPAWVRSVATYSSCVSELDCPARWTGIRASMAPCEQSAMIALAEVCQSCRRCSGQLRRGPLPQFRRKFCVNL
jgi:hypothetical protein